MAIQKRYRIEQCVSTTIGPHAVSVLRQTDNEKLALKDAKQRTENGWTGVRVTECNRTGQRIARRIIWPNTSSWYLDE